MLNQKQFADTFRKHGCYYQSFQLSNTETSEGFASIANAVSANQDEEVWLDLESYRDRKHMNDVVTRIEGDETPMLPLFVAYYNLIREDQAIDKTPAKTAGIDLGLSHDKWIEVIKKAHEYKRTGGKIRLWEK